MSFILLGILNAQAEAAAAGDYDLLETTILTSSASSVSFSSLNSTYGSDYKHLQLRWVARTDRSSTLNGFFSELNGDTGNNYSSHVIFGNGSSVSSSAQTSRAYFLSGIVTGANQAANIYGSAVIDLLDPFDTSKNTTARTLSAGSSDRIDLVSGQYINTNAVTQWTVRPEIGNFVSGSRFSLYGLRAA